jgi:IBR domain
MINNKEIMRKRYREDKKCLLCSTEYSYMPLLPWSHQHAIPYTIRRKELAGKTDKKEILDIWKGHKQEIGNYKILIHKSNRRSHSLCLDCAINYILDIIKKLDDDIYHNRKIDNDICCVKYWDDTLNKKNRGTHCMYMVNICNIYKLLPSIPIGILDAKDELMKFNKIKEFQLYDNLHIVIWKITEKLLEFTQPEVVRCKTRTCYGVMKKYDEFVRCIDCELIWCLRCNASHYGETCKEFTLKTVDHDSKKMFTEELASGNIKLCPGCNQLVQKNGGCNHITCGLCKTHFCWLCLWIPDKYADNEINPIYDHIEDVHDTI